MATFNQGKIVKVLESALKRPQQDFIWEFLKAYGTSAATLKRLRLGDGQRNVAWQEGDLGVAQKLYFRAVPIGHIRKRKFSFMGVPRGAYGNHGKGNAP